jgi:hypothetical protein
LSYFWIYVKINKFLFVIISFKIFYEKIIYIDTILSIKIYGLI